MGKFTPSRIKVNSLVYEQGADLTIATGVITITHSNHRLIGQGNASDDLVTINGAKGIGQMLILRKAGGATGTMTVKDASDNINSVGDRALSNDKDTIILIWNGIAWCELSYANNV